MIANDPRVGALWEKAVVETLGPGFKAKTYSEVVSAFKAEVAKRVAEKGGALGSNRAAGTAIKYARDSYRAVRKRFGKLAAKEGISLKGVQIHHTFGEVAQAPSEALTTTNLMFARGDAATAGSGHNFAHKVSEAHAAGAKNPGQQVAAEMKAHGIKPDVPELSQTTLSPAAAEKPPSGTKTLLSNEGKVVTSETQEVVKPELKQEAKTVLAAEIKAEAKAVARSEARLAARAGGVGGVVSKGLFVLNICSAYDAYKEGAKNSTGEGILNAAGSFLGAPEYGTMLRQAAEVPPIDPAKVWNAMKSGASPMSVGMGAMFGAFR